MTIRTWSGFQKIDIRSDWRITFAACFAHSRRQIDERRSAFPQQVAKLESLIRMLYDVEDQIKDLDNVLRRVLAGKTDWSVLVSHVWKSEHGASIREDRKDEGRQVAGRQRTRRARRRLLNKSTGHH